MPAAGPGWRNKAIHNTKHKGWQTSSNKATLCKRAQRGEPARFLGTTELREKQQLAPPYPSTRRVRKVIKMGNTIFINTNTSVLCQLCWPAAEGKRIRTSWNFIFKFISSLPFCSALTKCVCTVAKVHQDAPRSAPATRKGDATKRGFCFYEIIRWFAFISPPSTRF